MNKQLTETKLGPNFFLQRTGWLNSKKLGANVRLVYTLNAWYLEVISNSSY